MNVQSPGGPAYLSATLPTAACRACGSPLKHSMVDLGMSPPCEKILTAEQVDEVEEFFPLHVMVCGILLPRPTQGLCQARGYFYRVRLFLILFD